MTTLANRLLLLFGFASATWVLTAQVFTPPQIRKPKEAAIRDAFTVGADEPGCKDSPLTPRIAGCSILQCDADTGDSIDLVTSLDAEGIPKKETYDGATETIYYLCPAKLTNDAIIAAAESRFLKDGYRVAARSKEGDEEPLISVVKERQWIQITTYPYENSTAYIQTTLLAEPEEQIDAATVEQELATSGRVALIGFRFIKDQVDIPAGSEQLFTDLAAVLAKKPDWKIRIEANCDGAADPIACKALGEKRAEAVAGTLIVKGVEKERLTASLLSTAVTDDEDRTRAHIQLVKY
jgi:outer membrane protein OmpA-like peptidoglycan-associated protein